MPNQPGLLAIQLTSGVTCGDDSALLLYRRDPAGWRRTLAYYDPDLHNVGDALGDFFIWSLVPGPGGSTLFAAAHGTPWCSSRESVFAVDLLSPAAGSAPQRTLAHRTEDYSRDDHLPTALRSTPDAFELHAWGDSVDFDTLFVRPRIFRYQTTAGKLTRIQPVAENARDFIDVWLQTPWIESSSWSAQSAAAQLRPFHNRFDYNLNKSRPELSFGPVRACGGMRYQVQLDLSGDGPDACVYAHVMQNQNSFTLLDMVPTPNPACTGPDLMKRR